MPKPSHLSRLLRHGLALAAAGLGAATGGAQTVISGVLNGTVITDSIEIAPGTSATFTGNAAFTGPTATFGNNAGLYWQQQGILAGKDLSMAAGSFLYLSGANRQITFDAATAVTGDITIYSDGSAGNFITNQGTITHNAASNSGQIYADLFTNEGAINATAGTLYLNYPSAGYDAANAEGGTVTASGSGTTIHIRGNFDNDGTITAQGSAIVRFDGDNTTANLGEVILATGGRALLDGKIVNTSATLSAPTGGAFELQGGTILGGTIDNGALQFTNAGGYLDGATLTGDLALADGTYVRFRNGGGFSGSQANLGANAGIYWEQSGSLVGKSIAIGPAGYLYVAGAGNSLTLGAGTTVTGDLSIYSDGSVGASITNQGTLTHSNPGNPGQIYADLFTNEGAITATAGILYLNYPSAGYDAVNAATGTITATGSSTNVYIRGNFDNNGTITAQDSAVVRFDGASTTANLGHVVLATGGRAFLQGTLANTAATLTAPTGGVFELYGGTIANGTIAAGALAFTNGGGYLDGASLAGDLSLPDSAYVRFRNGAGFSGANATFEANAGLFWEQTGTLTGKSFDLGTYAYIYLSGAGRSLTLAPTTTVTGNVSIYTDGNVGSVIVNQGALTHDDAAGYGQLYGDLVTNEGAITAAAGSLYINYPSAGYDAVNAATGTITATGAGTTIYLRGNVDNDGLITAQDSGTVRFDGTNATANLGNIVLASGGRALLSGTLDNADATLVAPTGGAYELHGGTIQGGTIAGNALTFTSSSGYFDGATLTGDLVLPANTYLHLRNGGGFSGTGATLGPGAGVYWEQAGTLGGRAVGMGTGSFIYLSGAGRSLTFASDTTVTGDLSIYTDGNVGSNITNQGTLTHNDAAGYGQIYGDLFVNEGAIAVTAGTLYLNYPSAGYDAVNAPAGTITATGSGATVYIRGNLDNNGTIAAQDSGVVRFDGVNTTANLGAITLATGGRAKLEGTLDNTSATLLAPSGGIFELNGGSIQGGVVEAGALTFTGGGGYLDATSLAGDFVLPDSAWVRMVNGASFAGNAAFGASSSLYWQQAGVLAGKTMTMGTGSYLYVAGTGNTLTLAPDTTITGDISIYSDGSNGTRILNQGVLNHTVGSGTLHGRDWTNEGAISVSAGSLFIGTASTGYAFTNAAGASLVINGGTVYLSAPLATPTVNQGLIAVQAGTLQVGNLLLNGDLGSIGGAGAIIGDLTLEGGSLSPGNSIGTLTLISGDFSVADAATLEVELGGVAADRLVFQNPTSVVNIGAGLLDLSLDLLSAPDLGTTYTILTISSGGSGISGYFNNLPSSGSVISANFGGTDFGFAVNYFSSSITLVAVPEPGTYALFALGLGVVAVLARRRRG
ncbi:MAG TPA: PEP-CTERM sorting domain-containing protein [Opitutaceae bacterium]|nr:PEP-CTERM sorting domain-containing protein [Opitutaceae bacterium]